MQKITIEPTTGADTRSATEIVAKDVLLRESHLHRSHVRRVMAAFAADLVARGERHDFTKVDPAGIDAFHDAFARTMRKEIPFKDHAWWERHLAEERHHILDRMHEDADLLDLLEMVADCVCAGKARTGSVFPIEVPAEKLQRLLQNTVAKLINTVVVGDAGEACGEEFWTEDASWARCEKPLGHDGDCEGRVIDHDPGTCGADEDGNIPKGGCIQAKDHAGPHWDGNGPAPSTRRAAAPGVKRA